MGPHGPTGDGQPKSESVGELRSDEHVLAYARVVRAELYRVPQGAPGREALIREWARVCALMRERGLELPEDRPDTGLRVVTSE